MYNTIIYILLLFYYYIYIYMPSQVLKTKVGSLVLKVGPVPIFRSANEATRAKYCWTPRSDGSGGEAPQW